MLAGAAFLGLANSAEAQSLASSFDGFYATGYGGLQIFTDNDSDDVSVDKITWDTGFNLGARVGAKTGRFRLEGELGYRTAEGEVELNNGFVFLQGDSGDLDLSVLQGSINGFYDITDFPLGGLVATPYVGGGLGFASVEIENDVASEDDDDETGFLALFEAGLTLRMTPNFAVVPAYRYEYVGVEVSGEDDLTGHGLQIGARFDF